MIVAPSEPAKLRAIASTVGTAIESRYGADIAFRSRGRWVGIQRKEIGDLVSSVPDGRLGQQVAMMKGLDIAVLLVEGAPKFTSDGEMLGAYGRGLTLRQYRGVLWTARAAGVWVDHTVNLEATIEWVRDFQAWCAKDRHTSLTRREGPIATWGKAGNDDFARHLLMGIPGVGVELAGRIIATFGRVPWEWSVTRDELLAVEGVGAKTADRLLGAFGEIGEA